MSVVLVLLTYLLGSIPFAYIAGRASKGIDIRNFGDGNVGAANAYREIGPATGVAVLVADVSKGAMAVMIAQAFASQLVVLLAGVAKMSSTLPCLPTTHQKWRKLDRMNCSSNCASLFETVPCPHFRLAWVVL